MWGMTWVTRLASAFGLVRAKDAAEAVSAVAPPARVSALGEPRGMTAVYRAVQVITTAAAQLPLTVERGGRVLTGADVPPIIALPDPRFTRGQWITHMVASMALHGNAYCLIERDARGTILALRPLDPRRVGVTVNPATHAIFFGVEGRTRPASDVLHAHLQPAVVGDPLGLGPIQAARRDLTGAADIRDYASQWFEGTGQPTGILSSDAATFEDALRVRNAWNGLDETGRAVPRGTNPSGVKVLPRGFTYAPLSISPRDAQWLEAQEFNILQVARLFGIPSALMLAVPQGGSMTYSNIEQDWISFTRFSLMAYLRPLEEALTAACGHVARFNLDGLLRSDTKTRYDAYQIGINAGFLTVDEVRALEGRDPLNTTTKEGAK